MTRHHLTTSSHRQQGAFSILTAFMLLVLLMFLALVLDSGRLYMEQRSLQKVADTAALGALLLLPDGNCSTNQKLTLDSALSNAAENGFTVGDKRTLIHQCADISHRDGLRIAEPNPGHGRAVEVIVTHEVPSSLVLQAGSVFNSNLSNVITLQATAVAARDEPVAVFSIASQLLRLNDNKLLGRLLKTVGLDPDLLTLLDQHGVANLSITPSGLLAALGVGVGLDLKALTPDGLANALADADLLGLNLVDAAIKVLEDSAVAVNPELLGILKLLGEQPLIKDLDLNLLLFGTADSRGILSLITSNKDDPVGAALDAKINLGDLLNTSILVGAHGRALSIGSPHDKEDSALQLLRTVTVELGIVEPPSIAVGPVGTTAYNAQVRLKIDVNTSAGLLGGLLDLLGTHIRLPIIIDLANASGELTDLSCDGPNPSATIDVTSALGAVCIGHMPDAMWSTTNSCNDAVREQSLVKVLGLLDLHGRVDLRVSESYTEPRTFSISELLERQNSLPPKPYTLSTERPNPLHLGSLVKDLVTDVLSLLGKSSDIPDKLTEKQAAEIAQHFLKMPSSPYSGEQLDDIERQLKHYGFDWSRAILIETQWSDRMYDEWRKEAGRCTRTNGLYDANCVESKLINSLQSKATSGFLGDLTNKLVGKVVQPLLATLLEPILELVKLLLDLVGEYILAPLLDGLLGLEFTRTYVTLQDVACGAPRLVR